jgi:cytochrome P450
LNCFRSQLGKNKHVQDKLRVEVENHRGTEGKISFEALNEMPYLDAVLNETMRMHPPTMFTNRICTEPTTLEFDGRKVVIEKGINVYIPIRQLHYDPEIYEDPESFSPERFSAERGGIKAFKDLGAFLPFGDGPRICLGMGFAQLQSKAAIAAIVMNYEISVSDKTQTKLVIDPKEFFNVKQGGLRCDFKPLTDL